MALFHFYGDTSGAQSSRHGPFLVSVGAVATDVKWERFDRLWMATLAKFGISELHMKEFAQSRGEFAAWTGDNAKRDAFLSSLIGVARKQRINKTFVSALVVPDYHAVNAEFKLAERMQSPYALVQSFCLARASEWLQLKKKPSDRAAFFLEEGDAGQRSFLNDAERILGWKPIVLPKRINGQPVSPFQLADLIAYEHRLLYERAIASRDKRPLRQSLIALRRLLPTDPGIIDKSALTNWCVHVGIPRRSQS